MKKKTQETLPACVEATTISSSNKFKKDLEKTVGITEVIQHYESSMRDSRGAKHVQSTHERYVNNSLAMPVNANKSSREAKRSSVSR